VAAARLSHVIRSLPMTRRTLLLALFLIVACGESDPNSPATMSRTPCSVRGWVLDVKGAKRAETPDLEIARRTELFATASVWVEDTQYASGGIAENGAFVILDVPPQKAIIGFQMNGADQAKVVLENIPPTADVFIPDVILEPGGATVYDPKAIQVRIPDGDVDKPTPTGRTAKVAGYTVPVLKAPYSAFGDRRDYPNPGGFRPVATVR
jgi:hypothetical protein